MYVCIMFIFVVYYSISDVQKPINCVPIWGQINVMLLCYDSVPLYLLLITIYLRMSSGVLPFFVSFCPVSRLCGCSIYLVQFNLSFYTLRPQTVDVERGGVVFRVSYSRYSVSRSFLSLPSQISRRFIHSAFLQLTQLYECVPSYKKRWIFVYEYSFAH